MHLRGHGVKEVGDGAIRFLALSEYSSHISGLEAFAKNTVVALEHSPPALQGTLPSL